MVEKATVTLTLGSGAGSVWAGGPSARVATFLLDNTHGNCHTTWNQFGSPVYPTAAQFDAMRHAMEIPLLNIQPATATLDLDVTLPGVVLVHMCDDPGHVPAAVTNVRLHRTPTRSPPEVLVRWDDAVNRCVQTYEVLYQPTGGQSWQRVNSPGTIFNSFIHANNATAFPATGCYTIVSVDYWNRSSAPSAAVCLH